MRNFIDKVKTYFRFNHREINAIIISVLVLALTIGFNDKRPAFVPGLWVQNYINVLIIVILTVLVHLSVQKLFGLHRGYTVEFDLWGMGLFFGLAVSIVTRGNLWFLIIPGGIIVHHMADFRLGKFRYGLSVKDRGLIAFSGPLANVALAFFFKLMMSSSLNTPLLKQAMIINIVFAIANMIPLSSLLTRSTFHTVGYLTHGVLPSDALYQRTSGPPTDGFHLLYFSRPVYVFCFTLLFAFCLIMLFYGFWLTLILSLVVAGLTWLIYVALIEFK